MDKTIKHAKNIEIELERLQGRLSTFAIIASDVDDITTELDKCIGDLIDQGVTDQSIDALTGIYDKLIHLF